MPLGVPEQNESDWAKWPYLPRRGSPVTLSWEAARAVADALAFYVGEWTDTEPMGPTTALMADHGARAVTAQRVLPRSVLGDAQEAYELIRSAESRSEEPGQ
jgi:hypothetical protein